MSAAGARTRFRWTSDMVALLRRLNSQGLSPRDVAAAIGEAACASGMIDKLPSRAAVIAKTHALINAADREAERDRLAGRMRDLAAQGLTRDRIASRLGYGTTWVDQMAQRYKIAVPRHESAADTSRDEEIRRLAAEGSTGVRIALVTGLDRPAVYAAARRLGIRLTQAPRVKPGGWQQPLAGGQRAPALTKPLPKLRQVTPSAAPLVPMCALVDLPDWSCHWPEGDPLEAASHFCARPVAARPARTPGGPALPETYCPDHLRLAHMPRRHSEILHKRDRADLIACAAAAR